MLRRVVSKVGRAPVARRVVTSTPGLRETTRRFVGGEDAPSAVITAEALHEQGLRSTLHLRAGDVHTAAEADEHVRAYAELATRLSSAGCGPASGGAATKARTAGPSLLSMVVFVSAATRSPVRPFHGLSLHCFRVAAVKKGAELKSDNSMT